MCTGLWVQVSEFREKNPQMTHKPGCEVSGSINVMLVSHEAQIAAVWIFGPLQSHDKIHKVLSV